MVMTIIRVTLVIVGTAAYLGLAILGWGGWTAFFSHPARIALAVALAVMAGASLFADGNLSPGLREDRGNRWVIVALALIGLLDAYLPAYTDRKAFWTLDGDPMRWLGVVLFAAGGALRTLARLCARPSVQRAGRHPARAHAGHQRGLWGDPPPELSGVARQRAGVGPRLSFGGGRAAHGAHDPAAPRAHPCGRAAAAHAVWRRVRRLLRPDITADSRALLASASACSRASSAESLRLGESCRTTPCLHEGVPLVPKGCQ